MKKIISLLLAALMLFTLAACGGGDKNSNNSSSDNSGGKADNNSTVLSGEKEAVEVLVGFYINGVKDRGYDYDSNGNMIFDATYKSDGKTESTRYTWLFDEDNRLMQTTSYYDYDDGSVRTTDYSYDEKGSLCLEASSNGARVEYTNDANGNCILEQHYKADGTLNSKDEFQYDAQGRCILETKYNADGSLNRKISYEYDSSDRVICEIRTESDGEEDKRFYEYNEKGETKSYKSYTDGVLVLEYGNIYNADGLLSEYYYNYYDGDDSDLQRSVYTYDESGRLIRTDKYEDGESEEYYLYEYDANGRKSRFTRYDDDGDFEFSEDITYTESGLLLKRVLTYPSKTEVVDYEYKNIEVPVERADWVREFQMEYDP